MPHRTVRCTPDSPVPPATSSLPLDSTVEDSDLWAPLGVRCTPDIYCSLSGVPEWARLTSARAARVFIAQQVSVGAETTVASESHRTVRCTPDSPVNYSGLAVGVFPKLASSWGRPPLAHRTLSGVHRTVRWIIAESPLEIPEGGEFALESSGAPDTVRWCTGHCPVCTGQFGAPRPEGLRFQLSSIVEPKTWSFYWLSVNLLHLCNLYTRANLVSPNVCVGQFNHQN
jgi:hypothetical protein